MSYNGCSRDGVDGLLTFREVTHGGICPRPSPILYFERRALYIMNELEIKKVPFMGTNLMAARDNDGQIWAGVRWICDGMGMSEGQRKRQIANIQADKLLSKGGANLVLPTNGGNQDVLCLKLDFLPLWLAKISITPTMEAETPELAEKLMEYQLKAKDVLAAAFMPTEGGYTKFSKELQAIFMLDNRTVQHEQRITALEERMVVDYGQQRTLASQVNTVVIEALRRSVRVHPAVETERQHLHDYPADQPADQDL